MRLSRLVTSGLLLLAVFAAPALLPSLAWAQISSDGPSGYGRTQAVVQPVTLESSALALDSPVWTSVRRFADAAGRWARSGRGQWQSGFAGIRSTGRSGERGSKSHSPGLASARSVAR